ncbi:putative (Glutamate-ammonia-ligase) adenylyltransferase, subunit A (Modular protein) [Nitrospira moscoviensis]|uniref:Putative (Glutamate-ammonia-ligase) adenylyltransferase, subunit A (Modular protein) n=2 Tax=Nitrospira moscoviensis TaxID=42253 RepID=A0A0K2GAU2_NITMO|nr:putative (Glutamate-ammonia-ligase) adenylyltransferase, subunit A (Modular protein) [Nitrospira moscoviensis]
MSLPVVDRNALRSAVEPLCPDIPPDIVHDFISRMDPEYFRRFDQTALIRHLRLAARLTPERPCEVAITEQGDQRYDITVVAYDYFSEFATICGLLSASGLNIEEGQIFTFMDQSQAPPARSAAGRSRPGLSRKKIVDVFRVQPVRSVAFGPDEQRRLADELSAMMRLLHEGRVEDARQAVNRQLVEQLGKRRGSFSGLLHMVQITFDNSQSPTDTIMDIKSDDTPAFLYAFANALAMRNVYIAKAQFEIDGGKLHDRFYVRNRHGQKITDPHDQQQLRLTAVLIKQFTHALTWAPDPAKALEAFDQFLDLTVQERSGKDQQQALAFLSDKKTFPLLARLLGASDFLWEDFLRRQHGNLLPLLKDYRDAPLIKPKAFLRKELDKAVGKARTLEARKDALNQFKDRELFRIDMKHIVEPATGLADFSLALTELAEVIVERSLLDCEAKLKKDYGMPKSADKKPCPFAICGAGKFGGRELGYASDIEVLFVYGGAGRTSGKQAIENSEYFERLAQELLQWIEAKQEGIFHIDVRLRPHGGKGSLANPLDEITSYYSSTGLAAPFERQAMIKLRHVAGDAALGKQVEAHRDRFVYSGESWDIATALDLRRQQVKQFVKPGTINVKHSPGGVIDIEYAVQYLQVMHGHKHVILRTPNTMQALSGLVETGLVSRQDGENLRKAYYFLRMLIDGLRMVRGNAKDLVLPPPDSDEFIFLARRVGYTTDDWQAGARHLQMDIEEQMRHTKTFFERTFGAL